MPALTIMIPAAGAASRMRGGDKLLEIVDGQPLLARQASIAISTGCPVIVTLRQDDPRAVAIHHLALTIVTVPDAASGLSASLRAAARTITSALMILPADMPDLTEADLKTMITAFALAPDTIHRGASATGQPGHPVVLPARYLTEIEQLSGDEGARSLLVRDGASLVALPGDHAMTDLDTPEDWAAWRARHAASSTRAS